MKENKLGKMNVRSKGFFITGTDTGVGKTIITAALIKAIGILGFSVCGMKPIETGCNNSKIKIQNSKFKIKDKRLTPRDGMFLKEIANMDDSIDLITPITFENPLAPMTASNIEGRNVDLDKIKKAYKELKKNYDVVVVEGIGGLLVPIKKDYFVLNLAKEFGLPVIVVSRPGLGTINHTMLTVNYAIKRNLNVAGIIINYNEPPKEDLAEKTNPEIIKQISPLPLIGIFPYLKNLNSSTIKKAVIENLNFKTIKSFL